jgi:hypothetical protein
MKKYFYKLSPLYMLLVVGLTTFQACVKEKINLNESGNNSISPQYAGPLVYSSLTMADIMSKANKNGQIVADSTGFLTLVYKGNLFSLPATSIVSNPMPAQNPVNMNYALTAADASAINALPAGNNYSILDSSLISFSPGGTTQINTLNCKTANLAININYGIANNALIKVTIPGATLSGVPFTQNILVNYGGTLPVIVNENYSLNGYKIDMTNGGTTHNEIKVLYDIIVYQSSTNTASAGNAVSFTETFSNVGYNSIIGYLGQQFLSPNTDTVPITIFQNSTSIFGPNATFYVKNPLIKVSLTNSYGLPINANFDLFDGYTPGQPLIPITGAPSPLIIPEPVAIGQNATNSFSLTTTNSNVSTLINNFPKNVIYNVASQSNPAGPVYTNFITDTSQFNVNLEVDLPLYGYASDFVFQDTVKYSFGLNTNNVESITVRAFITNGFPLNVDISIVFVDSAYHVIDSLIPHAKQLVIPSAGVNTVTGLVTNSTQNTTDFPIPSSVIPQLNNVKYILMSAVVNTSNSGSTTPPPNVKIYNYYSLDISLGVDVKMLLKF